MNMFKFLLIAVVCGCMPMVNAAQEPSVAKVEDADVAQNKVPAVTQDKKQVNEQPVAQNEELVEDTDFKEWAENLGMTEEEQAQFLAEMDDESLAAEITPTENSAQTEKTETVDTQEKKSVSVENKVVVPETTKHSTELPKA
jgi:hypothetical protein